MEECLKLLKGERDEQKLAGLLLSTKFCKGDDHHSILKIYNAVGPAFLDRLLKTGMGGDNKDAYLQLSVTILAAICRVPEIARSKDMVSKVSYTLDILKNGSGASVVVVVEECYEFLFLVSTSSEDGFAAFYESRGVNVLANNMPTLPDGSHSLELAMTLVQSMLIKLPMDSLYNEYAAELSQLVAAIARQFALLHNALKFKALNLLSTLLSSEYAAPLHDALRLVSNEIWPIYVRVGIVAILQNRVASTEKFHALVLAESSISILGEKWLIDQRKLPGGEDPLPADRCLLLVLESSRVEVAVLLNEIAYLKYEASSESSADIRLKQQNLAIAFSLIEKIIKLISNVAGDEVQDINLFWLTQVTDCLVKLMDLNNLVVGEAFGTIFLACDTIMNILLKKEEASVQLDGSSIVRLLTAFASCTDFITDPSFIMMASSICTLIFDSTSEEALLSHPDFKPSTLNSLARLIAKSLRTSGQDQMSDVAKTEGDLHQIITAGYTRWADRFPRIKEAVKR
ncbi:hypothetical protein IFM89_019198 [Coptis chinensis]|uniref:Neurochondrin n=1 Tax=Coptis chinensis TaxID=261450 RepID=A0A835IAL2_9MAGN|nr:hypothetical protein IFM89_019198 [Coptis chinensis]